MQPQCSTTQLQDISTPEKKQKRRLTFYDEDQVSAADAEDGVVHMNHSSCHIESMLEHFLLQSSICNHKFVLIMKFL